MYTILCTCIWKRYMRSGTSILDNDTKNYIWKYIYLYSVMFAIPILQNSNNIFHPNYQLDKLQISVLVREEEDLHFF